MSFDLVLEHAHKLALRFLSGLPERHVNARDPSPPLAASLPIDPCDPIDVLNALDALVDAGGVASAGPRYFGFVTGGSLPIAVASDWLVSAWDQNTGLHVMSPAMARLEDVTAAWLVDLFGLPPGASVGFVTGATMANATALAAARDEALRRVGWDVERDGFQNAPRITMIAGAEAHSAVDSACRLLGFGTAPIVRVAADAQGRMRVDALHKALGAAAPPAIVCLQAGHVNTGAFDPFPELIAASHRAGAWVHVDGAFGLWAKAAARLRHLADGVEHADSWAVDAHKWLNVPYDSGVAIVAQPAPHRAAMAQTASYLLRATGERRDGMDWTPEASRRARAVPIYAALRTLGRRGLADLIMRCCDRAIEMADRLRPHPRISVLNDVVLNQVLIRVTSSTGANMTPAVIARVQQEGVCWVGGTTWDGQPAMRISISNWSTTADDIARSAASIMSAAETGTLTVLPAPGQVDASEL
jgi:glutamate/tyrosine decarboxylase-like PLP-dependent enzyme